jgi:dephospho-CoA kinase
VNDTRKPLVVGLTGSIGAGKSTVAALLAARGAPVLDADVLGREVWETSDQLRAALAVTFGPAIIAADGSIDQRALAREAFASGNTAARLNELVHPFLWARIREEIAGLRDVPFVVVNAALIVEWRGALAIDVVVVVDAPEPTRRERTRGKYDEEDFIARQRCQLDAAAKRAAADIIIDNSGTQAALALKAELLYYKLSSTAERGRPPEGTLIF